MQKWVRPTINPNLADRDQSLRQQPTRKRNPPLRTNDKTQYASRRGESPEDSLEDPITKQASEGPIRADVDSLETDEVLDRYRNINRDNKKFKYKNRGSLQEGGEIRGQSRVSDLRTPKQKKAKRHRMISLTQNVYIPTVVSVSQLARLLDVNLGLLVHFIGLALALILAGM